MRCALATALAALLCLQSVAAAEPVSLHWNELGARVTGKKVALVLPGGAHVEGKVRQVDADGLRLRVSKGDRTIPRAAVSMLQVTSYGKKGRLIGTLGGAAAASLVVAAQNIDVYEGVGVILVPVLTAVGIVGAAIGGYFIGKRIDRKVTEIRVLPDSQ